MKRRARIYSSTTTPPELLSWCGHKFARVHVRRRSQANLMTETVPAGTSGPPGGNQSIVLWMMINWKTARKAGDDGIAGLVVDTIALLFPSELPFEAVVFHWKVFSSTSFLLVETKIGNAVWYIETRLTKYVYSQNRCIINDDNSWSSCGLVPDVLW